MDDDAEIWHRARGGDSAAFAQLFRRHRDRVYGQALRQIRAPQDAEDVTALVFLEAWRKRNSVRLVNGSIIAWLLVTTNFVVRNQIRAMRRHRAAMATLPEAETTADFSPDVDDRLDDGGRAAIARDAFAALSRRDQDVITLCVIQELSIADAADALGVPQGTVKSRLSRAKQRLGAAFTELPEAPSVLGGA